MTGRRRRFTADFKKRVALDALRGDSTVQALAAKHEVHPNQVSAFWRREEPCLPVTWPEPPTSVN